MLHWFLYVMTSRCLLLGEGWQEGRGIGRKRRKKEREEESGGRGGRRKGRGIGRKRRKRRKK